MVFDESDALFAKANPNMKQPAIIDVDGTALFESLAINLYLMRRHVAKAGGYGASTWACGDDICPASLAEEGQIIQWSMWAMTELDPRLFELIFHSP